MTKMNDENRNLMKQVIDRLDRIEKALLGDPEHGMWGYNKRLSRLEMQHKDLRQDHEQKYLEVNEQALERIQAIKTDFEKKLNDAEENMDKRVRKLEFAYAKRKGIEMTIATLAGGGGGLLASMFL